MALFKHLWKSFENDEKLRQTIYSFACEDYVQKGNEYKEPKLLRTDLKSGMERAAVKYESNIKIQNRQAMRDGVKYGCLPHKKGNKQEYRFGALCVFKWMSEGYLELFNMIFEHKEPFKVTTHGKEKAGHGLGEAYDGFDRLLNKFPDMEDKEYVVSCFAMYKLEFTHRFILYAQLAKYMVENKIPIDTKIPESVMFAVTRLDSDNNVGCSAFVCDYDEIIHYGFINPIQYGILCSTIRAIIEAGVCLYEKGATDDYAKPEWTDEFFGEVSDFFKNKCCVTEAYKPLNISECENTGEYNVYDYIRSIYGNGMLWDKEEETYAREQHQKNKKASTKSKK